MHKLLFVTLLFLYGSSCSKDHDGQDCQDCDKVFCTEVFKTISIQVKNSENEALELDSFRVLLNGQTLDLNYNRDSYDKGVYPLVNDGHMEELKCEGSPLKFEYYYQDEQASKSFKIGKDCCHVLQRGSKKLEIIIP